ncbi:hypothetical protein [Nannocystis pusilla]|uniref:hypothetical protein n=1 Tax=Nannocystis pusilla TaxID=889268 RepID=UPI003B814503
MDRRQRDLGDPRARPRYRRHPHPRRRRPVRLGRRGRPVRGRAAAAPARGRGRRRRRPPRRRHFNDRLRRLDPRACLVSTLSLGTAHESLREPGGLAVLANGDLLVADTGHHRLVRLAADGSFQGELEVRGAPPVPAASDEPPPPLAAAPATRWFDLVLEQAPALAPGRVSGRLRLLAPAGWKFNDGAPQRLALEVSRRSDLVTSADRITLSGQDRSDMSVELELAVAELPTSEVRSELLVRVDAVLCGGDPEVCAPSQAWLRIPLLLTNAGAAAFSVDLALASPV